MGLTAHLGGEHRPPACRPRSATVCLLCPRHLRWSSYCRPHGPSQRQLCYRNDSLDEDLRLKGVKWFFSLSSPALTASTAWHFPRCLPLGMVQGRFACRLVNKSARGKQELLAQINWSEAACALLVPQKAYADNRSFVVARGGPRHLGTHSCG